MLISKFDLYKPGWLELVFENRNKAYGAYDLRQHYAGNVVRAMAITFLSIGLLFAAWIIFRSAPDQTKTTIVDITPPIAVLPPPSPPIKKPEPPAPIKPINAEPTTTQRFVPPVVTEDRLVTEKPVAIDDIKDAVGQNNSKGTTTNKNEPVTVDAGPGTPAPSPGIIYNSGGVEVMPMPVGGEAAWSKFLNKNLRYPFAAQAEGASGRVFVSFVVEKDGTLSNFVVERPAGHGFDEEATRVLKLAKAWKPGKQNGQAVRVKYIIPINFQVADQP